VRRYLASLALGSALACSAASSPQAASRLGVRPDPGVDTVRGTVSVVGTATDERVMIRPLGGGPAIPVSGPVAKTLLLVSGADVQASGRRDAAGAFDVREFVVRSVDDVPAIDGTLVAQDGGIAIMTTDHTTHPIANPPPALRAHVGQRVWITGPLETGAVTFGVIAPAAAGDAAQRPIDLPPNAPADSPKSVDAKCLLDAVHQAMAPYVAQAQASYPAARERFRAGLPPGHTFFVTTRLHDAAGREEQVFVIVDSIVNGIIAGRIASQINALREFRYGQPYSFPEAELVDWMVSRPDGSEEGNVVGNFLDSYTPPSSCT
jgi:hypothetical protein